MKKIIVFVLLLVFVAQANETYSKTEIKKMIAHMIIIGFKGQNVTSKDKIFKDIKAGLGGVILFDKEPTNKKKVKNIKNPQQLKKLTNQLQNISKRKLLISVDQEGGIVQRMSSKNGFIDTLKAKDISTKGESFAKKSYEKLSEMLSQNGINLNFAPDVDMALNKKNKVIYKFGRSYGNSSKKVIRYASIFLNELNKQGVYSVLKHFPGHGSSLADSHKGFVDITNTWNKKELEPFAWFINHKKVDMIMSAHVFNKNLDKKYPATLSYNINTKLLRQKLGYEGVLISDDMQMSAISKHYNLKQSVTLAINSGINILLFANQQAKDISLDKIVDTIYKQILNKKISLNKIIKSNEKIDRLLISH